MVFVNELDKILYKAQRHGQISFYMTNFCEEAAQVGEAPAFFSFSLSTISAAGW